jgi:serine/threonine protein kinase
MSAPNEDELLDRRYRIIRPLAMGGFGQTYIAEDTRLPGNPQCVVKYLQPSSLEPTILQNARRLFRTEAETLLKLGKYDQIPQLLAFFEENQEFYLVQELVEGHTLSTELLPGQKWAESKVFRLLQEVLGILEVIHGCDIIHRDIKPDNIIRRSRDNKLVLIDFGTVKQMLSHYSVIDSSMATIATGTHGYMPTEQSHGKPRPNSDIYALGIIAIQALTGLYPSQLAEDAKTGEILWFPWAQCSDGLAQILMKMVRYHFIDRYQTVLEVLTDLQSLAATMPALLEETSANETVVPVNQVYIPSQSPKPTVVSATPLTSPPAEATPSTPIQPKPTVISGQPSTVTPAPESTIPTPDAQRPQPTVISSDKTVKVNQTLTNASEGVIEAESSSSFDVWQQSVLELSQYFHAVPWRAAIGVGIVVVGAIAILPKPTPPNLESAEINPPFPALPCQEPPVPPVPTQAPDFKYSHDIKYYGPLEKGLPANGRGIMVFPNGDRYDGKFKDGKRNGCGTFTFANGRSYTGQFQQDHLNGLGVWTLDNGNYYIGEFKDNHCHGKGTFVFADGASKYGLWQDSKLVGENLSCDL